MGYGVLISAIIKSAHEISLSIDTDFNELFTTALEDHENKIWIGCWEQGLKKYDPETKKIIDFDTTGRFGEYHKL